MLKQIETGTDVERIRRQEDIKSKKCSFDEKLSFIAEKMVPATITAKLREKERAMLLIFVKRLEESMSSIFCGLRLFSS